MFQGCISWGRGKIYEFNTRLRNVSNTNILCNSLIFACVKICVRNLPIYMYVHVSIIVAEITQLVGMLPNYSFSPVANEIHKQMLKHKGTHSYSSQARCSNAF